MDLSVYFIQTTARRINSNFLQMFPDFSFMRESEDIENGLAISMPNLSSDSDAILEAKETETGVDFVFKYSFQRKPFTEIVLASVTKDASCRDYSEAQKKAINQLQKLKDSLTDV